MKHWKGDFSPTVASFSSLLASSLATLLASASSSLLRDRSMLQDGQEDPGAVETAGMGLELAVAEEFRRIVDGLHQGAPAEREAADETFLASDPSARG